MFNRSNQRINYFLYYHRQVFQSNSNPFLFAYGRTALKVGLINYKINAKHNVLVPEYICGAALQPFYDLKIKLIFYPINEDLTPDWSILDKLISHDVSAIMMVHYFGMPQQIEKFLAFANKNSLLLIEDNSHGYGGIYKNFFLGEYGHIGFSSPRKSFPILNGSVLYSKKKISDLALFPLEPVNIYKLVIKRYIGKVLDYIIPFKELLLKKVEKDMIKNQIIYDFGIDIISYEILSKSNLTEVRIKRNEIYQIWYNWCLKNKIHPIFNIVDNNLSPLTLPAIFRTKTERDDCYKLLQKYHFAVYLWPDLPEELKYIPNTGRKLFDKILCFPIHLGMKKDALFNTLEKIRI